MQGLIWIFLIRNLLVLKHLILSWFILELMYNLLINACDMLVLVSPLVKIQLPLQIFFCHWFWHYINFMINTTNWLSDMMHLCPNSLEIRFSVRSLDTRIVIWSIWYTDYPIHNGDFTWSGVIIHSKTCLPIWCTWSYFLWSLCYFLSLRIFHIDLYLVTSIEKNTILYIFMPPP